MSYLALYRKYRPKTFDDLCGQEYIKKIITNSIKYQKISHAYLFYGPRGTGKTSLAKLIAKIINCKNLRENLTPCDNCNSCISFNDNNNPDIIEIDAASNNGVDEIREIRSKVSFSPSISKYKIYIIDEVHMLSTGAFNALLKTLEEPPSHIIFILATTEYHKVPTTIISRCQCLEFSKLNEEVIFNRLKNICSLENNNLDEQILRLIAKYSNGGLRDSISMLDKIVSFSDSGLEINDFYELNGLVTKEEYQKLLISIENKQLEEVVDIIENLSKSGKNLSNLIEDLMETYKQKIIENSKNKKYYDVIEILNEVLVNIKNSNVPHILLEVALVKISLLIFSEQENDLLQKEIVVEKDKKEVENINIKNNSNNEIIDKTVILEDVLEKEKVINEILKTAEKKYLLEYNEKWKELYDYTHNKELCNAAVCLLDGSLCAASSEGIIVAFKYESNVNAAKLCFNIIKTLISIILGKNIRMSFITDDEWNIIKQEYILAKKENREYKYISPKCEKKEVEIISREIISENDDMLLKAENLFGKDIINVE